MTWTKYIQNLITVVMFAAMMFAIAHLWGRTVPEAQAQESGSSMTLQERQVRALETIANEMARMRRECQ